MSANKGNYKIEKREKIKMFLSYRTVVGDFH